MTNKNLYAAILGWFCIVATGFGVLFNYQYTPVAAREGASEWPADVALRLNEDEGSLLVFVHPKCPCTRATIAELERLYPRIRYRTEVTLVAYEPLDLKTAEAWRREGQIYQMESTDGVRRVPDPGGVLAQTFGATTSGEVFLYSNSGRLVFQGGVTDGRGHEGANNSLDMLEEATEQWPAETQRVATFGCSLY